MMRRERKEDGGNQRMIEGDRKEFIEKLWRNVK